MGLDQFVYKRKKGEKEKTEIATFRKYNWLHEFFGMMLNNQELIESEELLFGTDVIENLLDKINLILLGIEPARELLPTLEGLCFGSTEYDDDYFESLMNAKEVFEKILELHEDGDEYYYSSWW
jgi:hypothetical protein